MNPQKLLKRLRLAGAGRILSYSILVGLASGLGAVAFFYCLELATHVAFGLGAGVALPSPAGEGLFGPVAASPSPRPWLFFLLPIVGGLVSGLVVYTFAPEAEGHGTDAMIQAFHKRRGLIRARVPLVKSVATIATLASGGSAGREGPIAQIGAGVGSFLAQRLGLTARERRILLLAGTAGGLGAIFRAPLGGALTAVEVIYREDFETEALLPSIISSVTAYAVFSAIFGYERIFALPGQFVFRDPRELFFFVALGLVCIPAGLLYVRVFYGARDRLFRPLRIPPAVKPMLGGLGVALLGLALPQVYGSGWGQIQLALFGQLSLGLMLALALGKIVSTSLTIGSGGSGGVFGPTLFIGGMLGGAVGVLGHELFPDVVTEPGAYVLVGMAAFFAGVAKAPLGVLLMVTEMTGGYGLIAPLLVVSAIAILFTRGYSIYEHQVENKFGSEAHLSERVVNVLSTVPVAEVFENGGEIHELRDDTSLREIMEMLVETEQSEFPVRDEEGRLVGILSPSAIRPIILSDELDPLLIVADMMGPLETVSPDDTLYRAMLRLGHGKLAALPVVDATDPDRLLGLLPQEAVAAAYEQALAHVRELTGEDEQDGAGEGEDEAGAVRGGAREKP